MDYSFYPFLNGARRPIENLEEQAIMRKCEQCGNMVEHGDYEHWYYENDDDFKEELEKEGLGKWICLDCDHNNNWSGYWD